LSDFLFITGDKNNINRVNVETGLHLKVCDCGK